MCAHCDVTLKKKQVEKHNIRRCQPMAFICIDCHKTFRGNEHRSHVSCLTEQEKHWGDFAHPKHITQPKNGGKAEDPKVKPAEKEEPATEEKKEEESGWRGWKNEIKDIIKSHDSKMEMGELQQMAIKRYREFTPESDEKDE